MVDLNSFEMEGKFFESLSGQAIIDTGSSFIRVPIADFNMIKSVLESKRTCTDENGSFSCYCGLSDSYNDFPEISI